MHPPERNTSNPQLSPKPSVNLNPDLERIVKWTIATFGGLLVVTLFLLLARAVIHNVAFDQGLVQANTMNLPAWALTPVSWMIGAGVVMSLPALFRVFTTGAVNQTDRRWLLAFVVGALLVNFVSFKNTPKREGCSEVDACFASQGQPLRWFSVERDGRVVLWDKPGRHPTRNTALLPITPEIVMQWQARTLDSSATPNGTSASATKAKDDR